MKRLLLIYYAAAGKGQFKAELSDICDCFVKADYRVEVHPSQYVGDTRDTIARDAARYDCIVVGGGDGTLSEAVTGLMRLPAEERPPLGYIPCGSTNDFGNSLMMPKDFCASAQKIAAGSPVPIDVGQFNDRYFIYVAAFGAFTDVAYDTPQQSKNLLGHAAYVLEGIKRAPNIRPIAMELASEDTVIRDEFLYGMISNSTQVGGIRAGEMFSVSLDDGLFEVLLVKNPPNPIERQLMLTSLLSQNLHYQGFVRLKTNHLTFRCEAECPWTLDGEFGGHPAEGTIAIKRHAIRMIL